MDEKLNAFQISQIEFDAEDMDFAQLESQLEAEIDSQMEDLKVLEEEHDKIGNPATIGETVKNVVWEQFINQVGVIAGEDFIRENRGLTLDLRDSAHIQTKENFADGKIATHNYISKDKLEHNYDRYKNKPHGEFRREFVNPGMNASLPRAGKLEEQGIDTVTDIYTGRQISTQKKLEDGSNNPLAAQREHVKASAELYKDPSLQMANSDEELAGIINNPENLQGYTTAERNNRKSDNSAADMEERDKNKHWEKANERAEKYITKKQKEGEERLKAEGRKTQREEAFRIGGKALRSVIMGLLASLVKDIIQKLVAWFRSGKRSLSTFIDSVKLAIKSFLSNMKTHLLNAGNTLITTIFTAIFGPVIGMIKKAWIFLKQGYKSVKEAIEFFKNPANKNMPFSIKMMEVGKIIVTGATAGGAILLGETIEKGLMTIPVFAFQIPLLGSLASLLGMFFGALISGLIGALALNLIDKMIAKKQRSINQSQQISKKNDIINSQEQILVVMAAQAANDKKDTAQNVMNRHQEANDVIEKSTSSVDENLNAVNDNEKKSEEIQTRNTSALDEIDDILNNL
ncbi:cation diffusion facilitator family transporter [Segatella copri]|jgi:hypothetical protein